MDFLDIINSEDMSVLSHQDRCSHELQKPIQVQVDVPNFPPQNLPPIVFCAIKNKNQPMMYLLNSGGHYSCLVPISDLKKTYSPEGHTLLHLAVIANSTEVVTTIVKMIYPSEIINQQLIKNENTALHLAVNQGNLNIVECLLKYGADPLIKNANNDTAFHLALNSNIEASKLIGNYLIKKDINLMKSFLNEKYCRNQMPIEIFRKLKKKEVVDLLTEFKTIVDQNQVQQDVPQCSISCCSNCKRLRRCHICNQHFCPKHIDMHFHKSQS